MLRPRSLALTALAGAVALAGCDSLKGAMSGHTDTVAKAGSQELSTDRLAKILGQSQAPIAGPQGREVARNLAGLWIDYQLLGGAAAKNDSLLDPKTFDEATWAVVAQQRITKFGQQVLSRAPQTPDTANAAQRYANGELLAARHILFPFGQTPPQPGQPVAPAVKDSVRRRAEALRPQVTTANFAQMAQRNSGDPGSAAQGGLLGVFPKSAMVPEFTRGIESVKPGEISGLVETPYGYHIIYRPQFAEVAPQFSQALAQRTRLVAESTYLAKLEQSGKIALKGDAPLWAKAVAQNPDDHLKDDKVLATSSAGDLTAGRVARWISALPNGPQVRAQLSQAPDTMVKQFVRSLARNELLLKQADSAKIQIDSTDRTQLRQAYVSAVNTIWTGLNVAPSQLADSAKTDADRQRLAAARIEGYLDRLVQQRAQFVEVPTPVELAVRSKFEYDINDEAIDKALEQAAQVRASRDSARAAGQPGTAVPMPGAPPSPTSPSPQGALPPGQLPPGAVPPATPAPARP